MATESPTVLSPTAISKLKRMLDWYDKFVDTNRAPDTNTAIDFLPPEIYQVKTPSGGISASTDENNLSSAYCRIYQIINAPSDSARQVPIGSQRTIQVFNPIGSDAIEGDTYVLAIRDKFGVYLVAAGGAGGGTEIIGGLDSAGFTTLCKVMDEETGTYVTNIKVRQRYGTDGPFRCIDLDPCCLPDYRCVFNEQIKPFDLGLTCCDDISGQAITRILQFAFTNKTGDAVTDLPDLVYLVHDGGTLATWSDGPTLRLWGPYAFSAIFTLTCEDTGTGTGSSIPGTGTGTGGGELTGTSAGPGTGVAAVPEAMFAVEMTLHGELVVSGLTGGNGPTPLPCDLTNVGVSLGTFNYLLQVTNACGGTTTRSGTVDIAVSSWEDGFGVEYTGVQPFAEWEVPPWDAGQPFKTYAEAEQCCALELICDFDGCTYRFREQYTLTWVVPTGVPGGPHTENIVLNYISGYHWESAEYGSSNWKYTLDFTCDEAGGGVLTIGMGTLYWAAITPETYANTITRNGVNDWIAGTGPTSPTGGCGPNPTLQLDCDNNTYLPEPLTKVCDFYICPVGFGCLATNGGPYEMFIS